ncbi:hypothetical protein CMI46_01405 [Candidatus Pacearchaeota archaeon]|nr:hypothetical protein [Candidatus Pacearchaeota archaeon]|tara:strand:+ start:30514 stop:31314 length:801 start_codon:yes stop_codon:yes gene_type:complete
MAKKRVVFKPNFKPQLTSRNSNGTVDYANRRADISKKNTSEYFNHLLATLYGGTPANGNPFKTVVLATSEERIFHPDVVRTTDHGNIYGESKAFSSNNGSAWVSPLQLEMYARQLLLDSDDPSLTPQVNYGIFRYGRQRLTNKLYLKGNWHLKKSLTHNKNDHTRDLLGLPFNLLMPFLNHPNCRRAEVSHETSIHSQKKVKFWQPKSGEVNKLHAEDLEYLLDVEDDRELFFLDNLEVEQIQAPNNLYCGSLHVTPLSNNTVFYS